MNRVLYVVHGRPARSGKLAENRTLRNSSSTNQTVLATKKFRMTKSQENAVLNILTENSCLTREMAALPISQVEFVVISYIFSLCRSLSAVAPALHSTQCGGGSVKADGFVAMSQLCKTKPIC
jgi:alpha-D-ribose 1-methylphosphonate 5-triphosphate synthase subunit PhnI